VTKYLIVNADDYAMSPGISRGILEAHFRGVVTSTSALVNTAGAAAALAAARTAAPALGLGLHVNLSFGWPVLPPRAVPSLVGDEGGFLSERRLLDAMKCFRADDVRREVEAQFARFVELVGQPPDHLDSHQHLGCLQPDVFVAMLSLANAANIPLRSPSDFLDPCRLARLLKQICRENRGAGPHIEDFENLPDTLRDLCRRLPHFRSPDAFRYEFYGSGARLEVLLEILGGLPEGVTELMCHPGHSDDLEAYGEPRERELAILQNPLLLEAIQERGIVLKSFSWLGQSCTT
jgi:chitin disaccharide deacetylase